MESGSFQCQDQRQQAQTATQGTPSEHQEMLFDCEDDQTLAQVAWGCCGVSIFGDIPKPPGHSLGQLCLGGSA